MVYKLIIADDERIIREGLVDVINWASLGFEIMGVFEDGSQAIEYMKSNRVDVVLTDIKMTFVSGIEVSKYVYENNLNIKVILLSGYKEFDLAVDAIKYGVKEYLLKPTDMDKLTDTFSQIKKNLDIENEEKSKNVLEMDKIHEIIPILTDQFFSEILMGAVVDRQHIIGRMNLFYPDIDIAQCTCFIGEIIINDFEEYIENVWSYSKNEFYNSIHNVLLSINGDFQYHIIFKAYDVIQIFALYTKNGSVTRPYMKIIESDMEKIKNELFHIFNLSTTYKIRQVFESIFEVVENYNFITPNLENESSVKFLSSEDLKKLKEQQKLLLTNINAGDITGVKNIFSKYLKELKYRDFRTINNHIIEMMAVIGEKLKESGIDPMEATDGNYNYNIISSMKDIYEIENWGNEIFSMLTEHILSHGNNQENVIISRVQQYIRENGVKELSLEDVAEHFYLSPFYFSRIFKKHMGENFIDYILKVKIEEAIRLLGEDKYKVYEISEMIGYKSTKYFTKTFKKHTGFTPNEYRNRILKGYGEE